MRAMIVLVLAMTAALAASCSDETREPPRATVAVPTASSPPQLDRTPSATSAPVITSRGWIVHARGDGVYASALDGSGEIALDAGSVAPRLAQYAGASLREDGLSIYLLAPVLEVDIPAGSPVYDASVVRTSLESGESESLFDYGPLPLGDGTSAYVAVSPDGERVAYSASDGVHVSQFGALLDDLLITTGRASGGRCPQYGGGLWAPDGASLLLTKQLYEGSHLALVRFDDPEVVHEFDEVSGDVKAWSPGGKRACAGADVFVPAGVWAIEAATLEERRLDGENEPAGATRCAWRDDETVAFVIDSVARAERTVRRFEFVGHGAATYEVTLPEPYTAIEGWLPSGEGIIVSGYAPCTPCGERPPDVAVLLLDGELRSLPFEVGVVLAVVP